MKDVLLFGGGLDSTALLLHMVHDLKLEPLIYHLNYGQAAYREESWIRDAWAQHLGLQWETTTSGLIRELNPGKSILWGDGSGAENLSPELHGRNLVALLNAAAHGDRLWIGINSPRNGKPHFTDCTMDYMSQTAHLLSTTLGRVITIRAPDYSTDKVEVCRRALTHDPRFFERSMTCWKPVRDGGFGLLASSSECGECSHCKEKRELMAELGLFYAPTAVSVGMSFRKE